MPQYQFQRELGATGSFCGTRSIVLALQNRVTITVSPPLWISVIYPTPESGCGSIVNWQRAFYPMTYQAQHPRDKQNGVRQRCFGFLIASGRSTNSQPLIYWKQSIPCCQYHLPFASLREKNSFFINRLPTALVSRGATPRLNTGLQNAKKRKGNLLF